MNVFHISDLHINHRSVAYARRYGKWPQDRLLVTDDDVTWHNQMLAERWDKTVKPGDIVWVQGDLVGNDRHLQAALDWINERPGEKHKVYGNHDPGHPMHSDAPKCDKKYRTAFETVGPIRKRHFTVHGKKRTVLLSHFPYEGDSSTEEERDLQYRLRDYGEILLHGHTHSTEKVSFTSRGTLQVHVGVDAWDFTPVSHQQIQNLLEEHLTSSTGGD